MKQGLLWCRAVALAPLLMSASSAVHGAASDDELAKQLANPVAALISVPLQLNWDDGYDGGGTRTWLNVQPVIPVTLNERWNMISRTILPIEYHDNVYGSGSVVGLGDITQSLFFSPKKPVSGWIIGIGPAFLIPTGTDDRLGTGKWGAGPTAVLLKQTETGWSYGMLANQIWSFAGEGDRADVSNLFFQPFLTKGIGQGRTVAINLESSYDWERSQWTIPMNLTYTKVSKIGAQRVSWVGGVRFYLDAPDGGPEWGLRFGLTLLFPK